MKRKIVLSLSLLLLSACGNPEVRRSHHEVPADQLADIYMEEWQGQMQEKVFQIVWQSEKSGVEAIFKRKLSVDEMERVEAIMRDVFSQYAPEDVWKGALRDYFQEHLSVQEQADSLAFLQSTAGKKFLGMQIQTGNEVGKRVAQYMGERRSEFGDSFAKRLMAEFPELLR